VPTDPYRHVGRFQGLLHDSGQVIPDRIEIHGVYEPGRECGHGLVRVVPGPVEPAVHRPLHPSSHWPTWVMSAASLVLAAAGLALMVVWNRSAPVPSGLFGIRGFTGLTTSS
jgi:hypothetical protein